MLSVNEVRVSINVHDLSNGRCVWQGEAAHPIDGNDEFALAGKMIRALSRQLGKSARAAPLNID